MGKIQTLNWINLAIGHGYNRMNPKSTATLSSIIQNLHSLHLDSAMVTLHPLSQIFNQSLQYHTHHMTWRFSNSGRTTCHYQKLSNFSIVSDNSVLYFCCFIENLRRQFVLGSDVIVNHFQYDDLQLGLVHMGPNCPFVNNMGKRR